MNEIIIGKKKHTAPASWVELTGELFCKWAMICHEVELRTDAFALAVMAFYNIKPPIFFKLNEAQIVQLKNTLAFLGEENGLVKWIIPFVKRRFRKFYGPEDRLATSSILEFRFAEVFYLAYRKTKNEQFLDQLIATLYRRKGENILKLDSREQLSQVQINRLAPTMTKLPRPVRLAIMMNYEVCRNYIFTKYPRIFKPEPGGKKENKLPDLETIINVVAGGKFGNYRETEETQLYIFLNHLDNEIEQTEKLKSK